MKFTIVVPAYNEANFITNTLRSLYPQDLSSADYSIIVVNNASSDQTREAIGRFIEENKAGNIFILDEYVKGIVPARRAGVEKAIEMSGVIDHWIVNGDSDAEYSKQWLINLQQCIAEDNDADFITSKASDDGTLDDYPNLMKEFQGTYEIAKDLLGSDGNKPVDDKVSSYSAKLYLDTGGYNREYDEKGVEQMAETWRLFIKATLLGYKRAFCTANMAIHSGRRDKVHFLELETGRATDSLYRQDIRGNEENLLERMNEEPAKYIDKTVLEDVILTKVRAKILVFQLLKDNAEIGGKLKTLEPKINEFIRARARKDKYLLKPGLVFRDAEILGEELRDQILEIARAPRS